MSRLLVRQVYRGKRIVARTAAGANGLDPDAEIKYLPSKRADRYSSPRVTLMKFTARYVNPNPDVGVPPKAARLTSTPGRALRVVSTDNLVRDVIMCQARRGVRRGAEMQSGDETRLTGERRKSLPRLVNPIRRCD